MGTHSVSDYAPADGIEGKLRADAPLLDVEGGIGGVSGAVVEVLCAIQLLRIAIWLIPSGIWPYTTSPVGCSNGDGTGSKVGLQIFDLLFGREVANADVLLTPIVKSHDGIHAVGSVVGNGKADHDYSEDECVAKFLELHLDSRLNKRR
ncbi:MAG: hypothetical protein JWP44_4414 [Mucilaginibacter sp.]|nr:hypothetical protein [Mucilaginibacter sp.]